MAMRPWLAFGAGVLAANSLPHMATAITGRRHLTPLGGQDSPASTNLVWSALNLGASLFMLRRAAAGSRWGRDLLAFEAGVVAFSTWMLASERLLGTNHR